MKAGGGTSLYDAVYLVAEQKMLNEPGRKTVIILSDGADLTSKHTFEEMLRMAYQAEITVYAISTTRFGADIDHEGDNALRQLTEVTGAQRLFSLFDRPARLCLPGRGPGVAQSVQSDLRPNQQRQRWDLSRHQGEGEPGWRETPA